MANNDYDPQVQLDQLQEPQQQPQPVAAPPKPLADVSVQSATQSAAPTDSTDVQLPSWQQISQAPEFQTAKPEDKLVAFARWHDAAYNAAKAAPDWSQYEGEFNRQAAETQKELSSAAGGIDPDMARLKIAMDTVKNQESQLGRPLNPDEKAQAVNSLGPDVAKAYNTPPSVYSTLMRPVASFGQSFASGLGQTLQSLGYFANIAASPFTTPIDALQNKILEKANGGQAAQDVLTNSQHPLEWLGKRLQAAATEPEAEKDLDPRTKGSISDVVGHAAGGMLEFLGETALGSAELKGVTLLPKAGELLPKVAGFLSKPLTKEMAGKLAGMSVFGIHNAAEGINHAREAGASEDQVLSTALAYGTVGAGTAAISPFGKWMKQFDEATGGGLTTTLKKSITEGGQFAAQMFAQQFGNNAVNKAVLADNTDLLKNTFEQAKSGGATGIVASLVLSAILHGPSAFRPESAAPEAKPTVTSEADANLQNKVDAAQQTSPAAAAAGQEALSPDAKQEAAINQRQTNVKTDHGSVVIDWNGADALGNTMPHLRSLEVDPAHQRQGYGEQTIRQALDQIQGPVSTGVLESNTPAINLFTKLGFEPVAEHVDAQKGKVIILQREGTGEGQNPKTVPKVGEPTGDAAKNEALPIAERYADLPAPQRAYMQKVDHFYDWARQNQPEKLQAVNDAAGKGDVEARDKALNELKTDWRNSDASNEVGVQPTVAKKLEPAVEALAKNEMTTEDFANTVTAAHADEAEHSATLPQTPGSNIIPFTPAEGEGPVVKGSKAAAQPEPDTREKPPLTDKEFNDLAAKVQAKKTQAPGVSEADYQRFLAAGGEQRLTETDSIVDYLSSGEEFQKEPSDKPKKFAAPPASETDFVNEQITKAKLKAGGKLSMSDRRAIQKQAQQDYAARTAPKITGEAGTRTKPYDDLVDEWNAAKDKEANISAGLTETSPGKAIGRSPALIERDIVVSKVKDAQAQAKEQGRPFNVREAVIQAKQDFENQFNTDQFNAFVEPGTEEYTTAHQELVKEGKVPTKEAVAQRALEVKASRKAQVKILAKQMAADLKEIDARDDLSPEQKYAEKVKVGTKFGDDAFAIEKTRFQNRSEQIENYVDKKSEEYKAALEDTIEQHELEQGFPSVTDSRGYAKGLGASRAKALFERINAKMAELYPAEPTPNAKGVVLHKSNVWTKPGGEKTEKQIETSTGKFRTIRVGKKGFELLTEAQSPVTGDSLHVLEHKPTGKTRFLWTGDPRITVQQMARTSAKGEHLFVPDSIPDNKISPAIHTAVDPLTGKRYVQSVDTVFGNITEEGRPSTTKRTITDYQKPEQIPTRRVLKKDVKGNPYYEYETKPGKTPPPNVYTREETHITQPYEFEKKYDEKYGKFQRASKAVQPGEQEKIDYLNNRFDEEAARQPISAPEEEGGTEPAPGEEGFKNSDARRAERRQHLQLSHEGGTLRDVYGEDVAHEEAPPESQEDYIARQDAEQYPTDSFEDMMSAVEQQGLKPDNFKENVHLGDDTKGTANLPTSSANSVGIRDENLAAVKKLGLDGQEPILTAVRTIATDSSVPAAQRQLAKDLLANDKIDLSKLPVSIISDAEFPYSAFYTPSTGETGFNLASHHDGGIVSSVLHEISHHVLDKKLEPDYQRNAVEERVYQQREALFDHARAEAYKQIHGKEGTPEELEAWSKELASSDKEGDRQLYALTHPDELFAEVFSRNSTARTLLSELPPMEGYKSSTKGRFANFLDQIVDAIKSFITGKAVNRGSLYDQVLNEVMGLTREGEPRPELAARAEVKGSKASAPTQEEINSTLQQMNRAALLQEAKDRGMHIDDMFAHTDDELRGALGMSHEYRDDAKVTLSDDVSGSGYGGWLGKSGEYYPSPSTEGHMAAAQGALTEFMANGEEIPEQAWERPYSAMRDRGFVRVVNDHNTIHVEGEPTDAQRQMLLDTAIENGKALTLNSAKPPYKTRTIYEPPKVYAKAGTPQGPNTNPNPNVSVIKGTDLIVAGQDSANTVANMRGTEARFEVAQDFGGGIEKGRLGTAKQKTLTPEQKQDMYAASLVREAGGDAKFLTKEMDKIRNSTNIDKAEKDKWLPIYQHGIDNFAKLSDKVQNGMFDKIMTEQLNRLKLADVPIEERDNYITHLLEGPDANKEGLWNFLTGSSGSGAQGSRFFTKGRVFDTFGDAIAAGYKPKSEGAAHPLDISEITHRYVELTERLLQTKELEETLKNTNAPDGKPIIGATEDYTSSTGNTHTRVPQDYKIVQTGAKPLVVHKDFAPIFEYVYNDTSLPKPLQKTLGFIKRNTLMFDTFHVGRIMLKTTAYSKGSSRFGYGKGLSIMEYSDRAWDRAKQQGEVTPEMDKYRNEKVLGQYSRRDLVQELAKQGANFGRVADNLYASHASSIPGLKNFNPWVFQKLSRGAMAQTAVENLLRNVSRFPEKSFEENTRRTAKEYNEVFGNLQNQRIFKNKFYKNALDAIALAPNWAESQLLAEGRGIGQIGRAVTDAAQGKFRLGTVAQGQLSVVLGMLAANQVINYMSRGKSTFENEEAGHKLDAFIPSFSGTGRGFWFNPFEIGAEYAHAMHKYISQHQTPVDAAAQIAANKLNPLARGASELLSGRNYAGQRFNTTGDRITAAVTDALPLPLTAGGFIEKDPTQRSLAHLNPGIRASLPIIGPVMGGGVRQPDAIQKQLFQSAGMKLTPAQTPRSEVFAMAYPFRADKSYSDNAGEYTELRRALDNNNNGAAQAEIRKLVSRGHTERQLKAAVGMSPTGHVAAEIFTGNRSREPEFRKALTPQQLDLYKQAQKDHLNNAKKFLGIFREVRPDLSEALKANDKARKGIPTP